MTAVARRKCLHHPAREAAARCPSCARFFCRECVTEHQGRLACTDCLKAAAAPREKHGIAWKTLLRPLAAVAGLLLAWMLFYYAGSLLTRIPSSAHGAEEQETRL